MSNSHSLSRGSKPCPRACKTIHGGADSNELCDRAVRSLMNIGDDEGCVHEKTAHTFSVILAGSKLRQVMQDVTRAAFDVHPEVEMKVSARR